MPSGDDASKASLSNRSRELAPLLLTTAEAALVLNDSERHVYNMTASGELPSVKVGAFIRVPRRALYEYLAAQQRGGQGLEPFVTDEDIIDLVASAMGGAA